MTTSTTGVSGKKITGFWEADEVDVLRLLMGEAHLDFLLKHTRARYQAMYGPEIHLVSAGRSDWSVLANFAIPEDIVMLSFALKPREYSLIVQIILETKDGYYIDGAGFLMDGIKKAGEVFNKNENN